MASQRVVVHVTIERFFDASPARRLEDLVSLTDRVDGALARFAEGWQRPSADEAILSQRAPWRSRQRSLGAPSSPLDWAGELRDAMQQELDLDCSVGIAATRVAARICSRMARPRGVMLWLSGYENTLIEGLALEELDELGPEQVATLRARGIRTMGELKSLAPAEARELLGWQAPKLMTLIGGLDSARESTGGGRLSNSVTILARRLSRRLAKCGQGARGLELRIDYDDGIADERYTLLPKPTATLDILARAGLRLLEMSTRRDRRVTDLSLTATGLTAKRGAIDQLDLFRHSAPREVAVHLGRSSRV